MFAMTVTERPLLKFFWEELVAMLTAGWRKISNRRVLAVVALIPLCFTIVMLVLVAREYEPVPTMRELVTFGLILWLLVTEVPIWVIFVFAAGTDAYNKNASGFASFAYGMATFSALLCAFFAVPLSLSPVWVVISWVLRLL